MTKRFFSHYTFIYPNLFLKSHVVEELSNGILNYYPYTHEIANTEFHSGLLIYLPENLLLENVYGDIVKDQTFADLINRKAYLIRSFRI